MAYKNPEDAKEYQRLRQIRDKDRISVRKKKYRMANPDLIKKQKEADYAKHREARLAKVKEYTKKNWETIKLTKKKFSQSPAGRLVTYRRSAKSRGHQFTITPEDFFKIIADNCHYCGIKNSNGVDRKDSGQGYIEGNCLPCCKICNFMKRDLPYDEFILHTKIISRRF
jgi:hypothetical protein